MNCIQCGRRCQKLHTIIVLESGSTNAWRVECCGTCKQRHQRRNNPRRRRRGGEVREKEAIWLLIMVVLLCILMANGVICSVIQTLLKLI